MSPPRYLLVANPGTKRCEAFRRSFAEFREKHRIDWELDVVPWAEVVPTDGNLDHLPAFDRPAVVRLESPGKDTGVYRLMLAAGARADPTEPPRDWSAVELPTGILYRPGLWYRGFRQVLEGLRRSFDARPHLMPTACPLAVATMFDKNETLRILSEAGVSVPEWLSPTGEPSTRRRSHRSVFQPGWSRTYAKLNTGSSATGILVFHLDGTHVRAMTTLLPRGEQFFNTRQVRRADGDFFRCFDFLLREGATIQQGLPHARLDGQNADLRVVCVDGKPVASIFRLSPYPITNLHLGGRRGDFARCRAAIPTRDWLDGLDSCSAAADCFKARVVGVDLLFEPGFRRHHVLEVNAFGDNFPGWTDAAGRSLHEIELADTRGRLG